jgi:E3 ubiquitin-protein ligase HERC2
LLTLVVYWCYQFVLFPFVYLILRQHLLGRGRNEGSKTPKLVDRLQEHHVTKVFCGAQFSLALTKSGALYSWGKGDGYRLGHGSEEHVRFPKLIQGLLGKKNFITY